MSQTQFLFSGFGGQGILFAGKFLAYKGLMEDRQVSWLPSYGPEMRAVPPPAVSSSATSRWARPSSPAPTCWWR